MFPQLPQSFFSPNRFQRVPETILNHNSFPQAALGDRPIRLLNWNIAKQMNQSAWQSDFVQILETYRPNIVCLQEACLELETQQILELESMGWRFAPNFIDTYANCYCGLVTASHAAPTESKAIISKSVEPITNTPKVSLLTRYQWGKGDRHLWIINVHAINFVSSQKFKAQIQALKHYLSDYTDALILTGDFNTWTQERLNLLDEMAQQLGLTRIQFTPLETGQIKRFLLSPPLDHIYYRSLTAVPNSATVLGTVTSSDHKPLFVEFHLWPQ